MVQHCRTDCEREYSLFMLHLTQSGRKLRSSNLMRLLVCCSDKLQDALLQQHNRTPPSSSSPHNWQEAVLVWCFHFLKYEVVPIEKVYWSYKIIHFGFCCKYSFLGALNTKKWFLENFYVWMTAASSHEIHTEHVFRVKKLFNEFRKSFTTLGKKHFKISLHFLQKGFKHLCQK